MEFPYLDNSNVFLLNPQFPHHILLLRFAALDVNKIIMINMKVGLTSGSRKGE